MRWPVGQLAVVLGAVLLSACSAEQPINPSFNLSRADAQLSLAQMASAPKPLHRPLIVLSGIYDPGIGAKSVAKEFTNLLISDSKIATVHFVGARTFDQCAQRLIDLVEAKYPSSDGNFTIEVDVVACSMGGLVARHAALHDVANRKRLKIARLFTISTPHCGAKLAHSKSFDRRVADMDKDSEFIANINAQPSPYEIISYVRLSDEIVGVENAAPPGETPIWVCNKPLTFSHAEANDDPRILADIARRLRDEPPHSQAPFAPLPQKSSTLAKRGPRESNP